MRTASTRESFWMLRKPEAESDFYFVEADDPETAVPLIVACENPHSATLRAQSHPRYPGAVPDEPGRRSVTYGFGEIDALVPAAQQPS
jgi:hypothetical protein